MRGWQIGMMAALLAVTPWAAATARGARAYNPGDVIELKEYVGREWPDELIHYDLQFQKGQFPGAAITLWVNGESQLPVQLSDVTFYDDQSLRGASMWTVVTLKPNQTLALSLQSCREGTVPFSPPTTSWCPKSGQSPVQTDLKVEPKGDVLEVTTAKTGARFNLMDKTFDPPVAAGQVPPYLAAVRLRSGAWAGRGWLETPHKCRKARVWIMEQGPVFVKVGFAYDFDGYRGPGNDLYQGYVRIAANQELVEIDEEFSLGDPKVYQLWKPKDRARELSWGWWQWRPHEAESNFCFSLYEGFKPTKARWMGHNSTAPEKHLGPYQTAYMYETDYVLDYKQDRFDFTLVACGDNCPDQALTYMAWHAGQSESDVLGVIPIRAVDWINPDMVPHLMSTLEHHTDTSALRVYSQQRPDLIVKAPLHLGKRVWGLASLKMPEAGPTEDVTVTDPKTKQPKIKLAPQTGASQALALRAKYGERYLDKIKNWTLQWPSAKTYPSLFVKNPSENIRYPSGRGTQRVPGGEGSSAPGYGKQAVVRANDPHPNPLPKGEGTGLRTSPTGSQEGGLQTVLARIRGSQMLLRHAKEQQHLPIMRYIVSGGQKNAEAACEEIEKGCQHIVDAFFAAGYGCGVPGRPGIRLNINELPWHLQRMSGQVDLILGMPELSDEQKTRLKTLFCFCVHMLHDPELMPPRATGVGWGSGNMPINMRGAQAITACLFSDNPDAQPWLDQAVEYVDILIADVWAEDGSTISCPHYTGTQADPLMNMTMPLYYAGKLPPIQKKWPRLENFLRLMMDRLTPPEPRGRYLRLLPTIGHTQMEPEGNLGKYAVLMNLTNRKLAGQAYWMWKRGGAATEGFLDGIYYMHEEFEEAEPKLASTVYPGSAAILRNGFPREDETFLMSHVGNQGIDHYEHDVGAFLLYAKGAPLMMDFSAVYVCIQSLWHNNITWNIQEHDLKKPCPGRDNGCFYTAHGYPWIDHQFEPHTLLERQADRQSTAVDAFKEYAGQTRAKAFGPEADYTMAAMPLVEFAEYPLLNKDENDSPQQWAPFTEFKELRLKRKYEWQRRFIFVKDSDLQGPNYLVIADDLDGQDELAPTANFWCLADSQKIEGDTVRWKGQYNVDLDLYVAWPKQPQITSRKWWHTMRGPVNAVFKNGKEEQIAAHVHNRPGNGGFTVVLYPRRCFEIAPTYSSTADGKAVAVTIGQRHDVIFASRQPFQAQLDGVTLEGTVAVVKRDPEYTALVLPEAGTVRVRAMELRSDAPVSLRIAGQRLSGQSLGKGKMALSLGKVWAGHELKLDGKTAGAFDAEGRIELALPAGPATLIVEPPAQ